MSAVIRHGDCREVMRGMEPNSIDAIVTDPPYHLTSIVRRFGSKTAAPAKSNGATGVYARASRGFMGQMWDGGNVAFDPETWVLASRVLKPGGHLLAFGGARTYHRLACAIEDAGFEIRDQVMWIYGSGWNKVGYIRGKDGNQVCDGWAGSLKPAHEPLVLARKPLVGTVAENVRQFGTGALNIDSCRVSSLNGQRPDGDDAWADEQSLCGLCAGRADKSARSGEQATKTSTATRLAEPISNARAGATQADTSRLDIGCFDGMKAVDTDTSSNIVEFGLAPTGQSHPATKSIMRTRTEATTGSITCASCGSQTTEPFTNESISVETKSLPQDENKLVRTEHESAPARWPANLIHDGSDEVEAAFAAFGEKGGGFGVRGQNALGIINDDGWKPSVEGQAVGFGDTGTASRFFYCSKASKKDRDDGLAGMPHVLASTLEDNGKTLKTGSGNQRETKRRNNHPTVKPTTLMRYLCRLITPPGGTVFDPFAGSGSTGRGAVLEGFSFIGIEMDEHYSDIARLRINAAVNRAQAGRASEVQGVLL